MKINKISLEFTAEELEALSYTIHIGIRSFRKRPLKEVKDWVDTAEIIRKQLPTKLHLYDEENNV